MKRWVIAVVLLRALALTTVQAQDARILPHEFRGLCSFSDGTLVALRSSQAAEYRPFIQVSTDAGGRWFDVHVPASRVSSIGIAEDVLYVSSGDAIYASDDRGDSWTAFPAPSDGGELRLLVEDGYPLTAYQQENVLLDRVWVYDPEQGNWSDPAVPQGNLYVPQWTSDGLLVAIEPNVGLRVLDEVSMTWQPLGLPPLPRQELTRGYQLVSHLIVAESGNGTHWVYSGGHYDLLSEAAEWKSPLARILHIDDRGTFFSSGWAPRDPELEFQWNRTFIPVYWSTVELFDLPGGLFLRVEGTFFTVTINDVPSLQEQWYWYDRTAGAMRGSADRVITTNGSIVTLQTPNYAEPRLGVSVDGGMSYHTNPMILCGTQGVLQTGPDGMVRFLQANGCNVVSTDNARSFHQGEALEYVGSPFYARQRSNGSWELRTGHELKIRFYNAPSLDGALTFQAELPVDDYSLTMTGDLYKVERGFEFVDLNRSTDMGKTWSIAWSHAIDRSALLNASVDLIDDFRVGVLITLRDGSQRTTTVYRYSPTAGTATVFNTYPEWVTCMERTADGRLVVGCGDLSLYFHNENDEPGAPVFDDVTGPYPLQSVGYGRMPLAIGETFTLLTNNNGIFSLRVSEDQIVTSIGNAGSRPTTASAEVLHVAPNPSHGAVTVTAPVALKRWYVSDLLGRTIMQREHSVPAGHAFSIDLPTGTYILMGDPAGDRPVSAAQIVIVR